MKADIFWEEIKNLSLVKDCVKITFCFYFEVRIQFITLVAIREIGHMKITTPSPQREAGDV